MKAKNNGSFATASKMCRNVSLFFVIPATIAGAQYSRLCPESFAHFSGPLELVLVKVFFRRPQSPRAKRASGRRIKDRRYKLAPFFDGAVRSHNGRAVLKYPVRPEGVPVVFMAYSIRHCRTRRQARTWRDRAAMVALCRLERQFVTGATTRENPVHKKRHTVRHTAY